MPETTQNADAVQKNPASADQNPAVLQAEEVEAVIAPRLSANHNENVLATRLDAETVEAVIAPRLSANHNESVLAVRLHAEAVEAVIVPRLSANHNETVLG